MEQFDRRKRVATQTFDLAGDALSSPRLDRLLLHSLTDHAVFAVSSTGIIVTWNAGAERIFGYHPDEAIGTPFTLIFTEHDVLAGAPQQELREALSGACMQHDRWHERKDASRFWGTNTVQPVFDNAGSLLGFTKLIRDTTENHIAVQALRDSEQRHRLVLESVRHFAMVALDADGMIESWPPGAESVFGFAPSEIIGQHLSEIFVGSDDKSGSFAAHLDEASISGTSDVAAWFSRKDGSRFFGSGKLCRLHSEMGGGPRGFVQIVHDITESAAAQKELRQRAQSDELTALPNRRTFFDFVLHAIAVAKRSSSFLFAVLFIDLDHFKRVNDQYGHATADDVLKEVARRLEGNLRSQDVAARIGGDEFAVLLNGIKNVKEADDAAECIADAMRSTMNVNGTEIVATVSVGIALGSALTERPEDVLREADIAMYAAKRAGRSRAIRLGTSSLSSSNEQQDEVITAITNGEMRVHFQPMIRLSDHGLTGFEALIRWQHPTLGLLQPLKFITIAERNNAIFVIDRFMIEEVLRQLGEWQHSRLAANVQVSVNISGRELSDATFVPALTDLVYRSGVSAHRLRLEITESASVERSASARATIAAIRALGVSVDIDDFGTGYSSLQALLHLEIDALKIDASFVASIGSAKTILLDAVIGLAHNLGTIAIAEGIETNDQFTYLKSRGCDIGQGFYFSAPLESEDAMRFAANSISRR